MTLWEYRVTFYTDGNAMNGFGGQGWELVAVVNNESGNAVFYWKRPLGRRPA